MLIKETDKIETECRLVMSCVNRFGILFQIIPFIEDDMSAEMVKMELQTAQSKLEGKVRLWEKETTIELSRG